MNHRTLRGGPWLKPSWIQTLYLALSCTLQARAASLKHLNATEIESHFNKITPSASLVWTPCFDNFTCARLEVPYDYDHPSIGKTAIAFLKYPAQTQPAKDLLINFGGPGGSGVAGLRGGAPFLAKTYGPGFNLIGFDPRGVYNSGPSLECFPGDPENRNNFNAWYYRPASDASSTTVTEQYSLAAAFGQWCNKAIGGPNGTARYANTPAVATDMLTYAEAQNVALGKPKEAAKVAYVGYSYGTVLGATFASLFPDRIDRMILDGVDDAEDYFKGAWSTNLWDTDAAVESFFKYCYEAGPAACVAYANSTAQIEARLQKVLDKLKVSPIPIVDRSIAKYPIIATYSDLKDVLLKAIYTPVISFPLLAQIIVDLEHDNGTSLFVAAKLKLGYGFHHHPGRDGNNPSTIISCADGAGKSNITSSLKNFEDFVESLYKQSKWVSDVWPWSAIDCRSLDVLPPPSGRFPIYSLSPSAKNTSNPILFISNVIDPVTPVRSGRKMAAGFPGSVLLENNYVGHTSMAVPSNCSVGYVRAYLANASLPAVNTTCQPDVVPFKGKGYGFSNLGRKGSV